MTHTRESGPVSRMDRWAGRIDRLSRMMRVSLSLGITLVLVVLIWLVLGVIFGVEPLDPSPDTTAPLFLTVCLGMAVYAVGWAALVGFELDPERPWRAGPASVLMVVAGLTGLIMVIMLVIYALVFERTGQR